MKSSLSLAIVGMLMGAASAQANWLDSVFRTPVWGTPSTQAEVVSTGTVVMGDAKGEVIVEDGCGCAFEPKCGCHPRLFDGSWRARCGSWMTGWKPGWLHGHGCGCGCCGKEITCAAPKASCGCGWSLPTLQLPKLPRCCGCRNWHVSFAWPVRIHRHACGCGHPVGCGCGCGVHGGEWKTPVEVQPMPVNPPQPVPETKPMPEKPAKADRKA